MDERITMTCLTKKQKFDVENPPVVVLANGRFAYRVKCPWTGKNDKELFAFKFCSGEAHKRYLERTGGSEESDHVAETSANFPSVV